MIFLCNINPWHTLTIDLKGLGRCIKHYRMQKRLSQEELAAEVHTTSVYISYIETGSRVPSLETLIRIANTLDVSADDLLSDTLKHSISPIGAEIHNLLLDCNRDETAILTRTMAFLKALLSEFGI